MAYDQPGAAPSAVEAKSGGLASFGRTLVIARDPTEETDNAHRYDPGHPRGDDA